MACSKKDAQPDTTASAAPAASMDRTADASAIIQADSGWLRNVLAKNVDSIMTYYAPEAVSYGFAGPPSIGADQIRAAYTEMVKATITNPKMLSNTVKFSDDGSMAFDHGTYQMTVQPPGGKVTTETGGYLNVWKKVDGQWKMMAEMSTPVPAPKS
jgi:uncharacterized protein (TIGR02246 family)